MGASGMRHIPRWLCAGAVLFGALGVSIPAHAETSHERILGAGELRTEILTIGTEDREPGTPLIVFLNALGSAMDTWDPVLEEVASFAAILAYNRPGIGGSESDGSLPTAGRVTRHLQELLAALEAAPPYILVGHSWGGPLALHFAGERPGDIVGLVLIDPPDWTQESIFPLDRPTLVAGGYDSTEVDSLIILRDSLVLEWVSSMEEWAAESPGIAAEWRAFHSFMSAPVAKRGVPPSPPVPVAILMSGRVEPLMQFSEDLVRAYRASRCRSFSHMLLGLEHSMLIVDTDSGHEMHVDSPLLVSETIQRFALINADSGVGLPE